MAYTNVMAEILTTAKEEGIGAGVAASFHSGSAVSLPWLSVSLLSPVLGYSRLVGVWMQEFWLAVLAISVFSIFIAIAGLLKPHRPCFRSRSSRSSLFTGTTAA